MAKWGTYFITGALIAITLTYILQYFDLKELETSPLFPVFALLLGGIGTILHLFNAIKNNTLNLSVLMLLISIMSIIFGISFQSLGMENAKYLVLSGTLLVALWIIIPNKAKNENEKD